MRSSTTISNTTNRLLSLAKFQKKAVILDFILKVPLNKIVQSLFITSALKKGTKDELEDTALFVFNN
jgi:hypothetical protein